MSSSKDYLAQSNRSNVPTRRFLLLHHPILYHDAAGTLEANAQLSHVGYRGNNIRLFGQSVLQGHPLIGPPKYVACAPPNKLGR